MGLMYGVLMPTLPSIPKPLAWGALLMPLFWTAVSFVALGSLQPGRCAEIEWPWFVLVAIHLRRGGGDGVHAVRKRNPLLAGMLGGIAGGLLMPIPALSVESSRGHGIWYPGQFALRRWPCTMPPSRRSNSCEAFHADWLVAAIVVHAMSRRSCSVWRLRWCCLACQGFRRRWLGAACDAAVVDGDELRPDGRGEPRAARAASTGPGSWRRNSCSEWWRRSSSCARSRSMSSAERGEFADPIAAE